MISRRAILFGTPLTARNRLARLTAGCSPANDLLRALEAAGVRCGRYGSPAEAIRRAPVGSGVMILADGYPRQATAVGAALWEEAERKALRVLVEYPSGIPDLSLGAPCATTWERVVVASDAFAPALAKLSILAVNDCHFVPAGGALSPDLVVARVAGYDRAVFGLPPNSFPILFAHPSRKILVSTTKLSHFITGRYAPAEAWARVWGRILRWLLQGPAPALRWTPVVRPSFSRGEPLPEGAEANAFERGAAWYTNARMFIHPSWQRAYEAAAKFPDRVGPAPEARWPAGDGSLGMLEGVSSRIRFDGSQPVRWWLRADCMAEAAFAMAIAGKLGRDAARSRIGANLLDSVFFRSNLHQGARAEPGNPAYGLLGWNTVPKYWRDLDGFGVYYGDDNARAMLGAIGAAAALNEARWDEAVLRCLLANLRTTGRLGFREPRIDDPDLQKRGWRHYREAPTVRFQPHYEAYLWAMFLWAFDRTRYAPFLELTRNAVRMTVEAYPDQWRWTNGIAQERARMLLPLAWLVRVEDKPEHRAWLRRIAEDLLARQDPAGALGEELGPLGRGDMKPPQTNAEYGTAESPLIQENGDPACDLLYTTNFAFLGLHEAGAATGEARYRQAADRLAGFLCRVQVRSDGRPELDGAWFRAFDYRRWDYWASNSDSGWGAWTVEAGWTQAWLLAVLGMRRMRTSLWDLTRSRVSLQRISNIWPGFSL